MVLPHAVLLARVAAELEGCVDSKGDDPEGLRGALDEVHVAVAEEVRGQRGELQGSPCCCERPAPRGVLLSTQTAFSSGAHREGVAETVPGG